MLYGECLSIHSKLCGKGHSLSRLLGKKYSISILYLKKVKNNYVTRSTKKCPVGFTGTTSFN